MMLRNKMLLLPIISTKPLLKFRYQEKENVYQERNEPELSERLDYVVERIHFYTNTADSDYLSILRGVWRDGGDESENFEHVEFNERQSSISLYCRH